jgi:hypothetical protein
MDAQSNAGQAALNCVTRKCSHLVQTIDPAFPGVRGLRDLWQGWRDYRELWLTVGIYDIRKRYRRSLLGPFWITISLGAFILGLSFIYSPLVGGAVNPIGLPRIELGRAEHPDAWMGARWRCAALRARFCRQLHPG